MPVYLLFLIGLFLAIWFLVYWLGRILYAIAKSGFRKRKPARKIQHPEFGELTSEDSDGLWVGEALSGEWKIRFVVGGSEAAPDERCLAKVRHVVGEFTEVERRAQEYLRSRELGVRGVKLDIYQLDVSNEKRPGDFTIEFLDGRDDWGIWRVEFTGDEPMDIGFDD